VNAGVTANISASFFTEGANVIAVRCDDDATVGGNDACYFDFLFDTP
jgi:hypothetical protein